MKKFKQIDFYISVLVIVASMIYGFIVFNNSFIYGYFIVGGWQIISMIVHAAQGYFTAKGGIRYFYHFTVTVIFVIVLLGLLINPLLFIFVILLFAAPFMAIFYTYMCYRETFVQMKRPLHDLK